MHELAIRYNIEPDSTHAFLYRGGDKAKETNLPDFADYISRGYKAQLDQSIKTILIQTDEPKLAQSFKQRFPKTVVIKEAQAGTRFKRAKAFLAALNLIAQAKLVTCTSGNVSLWLCLFRRNSQNINQFLSPKKEIYGVLNESFTSRKKYFWLNDFF